MTKLGFVYIPLHPYPVPRPAVLIFCFGLLSALFSIDAVHAADQALLHPEAHVAERAKAAWESGATARALEIIDEWAQQEAQPPSLNKLRGDILASSRRPQDAVQAYEAVLALSPASLDARWAKWSVLVRSGQDEDAVAELQRIAQLDAQNPLIHLRLAQELRKLDRLEESLESYKKAVELAPDLLNWRMALARARFDILDYAGADRDVRYVLDKAQPGSPLELPARNLSAVLQGSTQDRGRRFDILLTPEDVSPAQLKEWALMRADAWRLFEAGRYAEAEPMYRRLLALNPRDPSATHQLGLTLMQLGRCKEALGVFRAVSDLDPSDDQYADTVFRMGQCLVELEQWEDAFVHFQTLYDSAVEFENANKGVALPPDVKVLDKNKLARWLDKVRPHVPELAALKADAAAGSAVDTTRIAAPPEEELYAKAMERMNPQKALDQRASLAGKDADISWFRFVIPSAKVMRDDFPTGAHEFIPLSPGDSFPVSQQDIYLVFGLVSSSYDAVPLAAQCSAETSEATGESRTVTQDHVVMAMSDLSGFFKLPAPAAGWTPGLYRCGLFAGESASADTHVDEVRFRIMEPLQPVGSGS